DPGKACAFGLAIALELEPGAWRQGAEMCEQRGIQILRQWLVFQWRIDKLARKIRQRQGWIVLVGEIRHRHPGGYGCEEGVQQAGKEFDFTVVACDTCEALPEDLRQVVARCAQAFWSFLS